jgi:hypothetical protein
MGRAKTLAGIAMEKFVKQMMVFKMMVSPVWFIFGMVLILSVTINFKDF